MLSTIFDAVAAGLSEPPITRHIAMPLHQPPSINRDNTVSHHLERYSPVHRNLTNDTWLFDTTDNLELGRIMLNDTTNENRTKITTTHGAFIVNPTTMSVLRGKYGKKSIYGHVLSVYTSMGLE